MRIINLGYLFLISGVLLTSFKYVTERKELITEKNKIEYTIQKHIGYLKAEVDTYDMVLSIPQINLKKGIYIKNSKKETIQMDELSGYPNYENSNVVLIVESAKKESILERIEELNQDSLIELYYDKTKYIYKINHYYQLESNSVISNSQDTTKKIITLIIINQKDKSNKLVYIGYLIDEIKY